jgi:PAS domain S-box-containing protein
MRNFVQSLERPLEATMALVAALFRGLLALVPNHLARGVNSKAAITLAGLAYIGLIGTLDLLSPQRATFEFLYLLGCAFVGWTAGGRPAAAMVAASGLLLVCDDARAGLGAFSAWVIYWNLALRVAGLGMAAWLASEAARLMRQLEETAQQRTARLQSEVEEHKATSARLRDTLELFKQVTENITEVFWVSDPAKSRINYVSVGYERVWGQPRQTVYANPNAWLEAVHPDDRPRVTRAADTRQVTGEYDEEYRIVRPDGSICWVHDRAFPVRNEQGEVYRIAGITEDITVRKRAEEAVRRSEAQLRTIINSAPIALLATDARAVITFEDGQALRAMNVKPGERTGRRVREVYANSPSMQENIERALAGEEFRSIVEYGPAVFECHFTPNRDPTGQNAGFIAVAMNVTERTRLERQILEISDREQARIGQDVHDGLCQQLIGVAFAANSLQQALGSEIHPQSPTAQRLCRLLDEAITESRRVCRGLYPVRLEAEGLGPALEELAASVRERHAAQCRCEVAARRVRCGLTASTHLYRIAQEAVNNALKHSGCQNILIRLSGSEASLELAIKDDGHGIKSAPRRSPGMGLHIMDYRARSIGGTLRIQGDEAGTLVACRIPCNHCHDPIS